MAKSSRKKRKPSKSQGFFSKKKIAIILLIFFTSFAVVYAVNYFQLFKTFKEKKQENNDKSTEILMDKMKKMLDDEKNRIDSYPYIKEAKKLPPVTKQQEVIKEKKPPKETHLSEIEDYKKSLQNVDKKIKKPSHVNKKKIIFKGKAKLAIIIDDVAFAHQTRLIKKIPFKVSPSFFPPTKLHPNTINLAKEFKFSMIHLPTEALHFGRPEPDTLMVRDSIETIRKRIRQIKNWFPFITYYNNHTGSKFTADYKSMDKLIKVMKEEKLHFVDSRTTAQTKGPVVAKKYNVHLYQRDIFLDNSIDKKLIKKQLKKAIAIAKRHGIAVAIGHPHENTLKVLINAKNILKDVDLVYLKDL
ncbi:divergent polysaccharide deacetylase family protein [Sulfurospirillum arcachonense]|uniref:divergent polysaccharide deacetylase family protein n=1 Tax=Sulfurospirillum arcachonense TaxID=57666 RepID=UPI00046AC3F5|nr:divergent polysaccharide deacetylase family protein [Sulfurospirillum arcachonense]